MNEPCPHCGSPTAASATCEVCGKGLLVDLVRVGPPVRGKPLFEAARALAGLGAPAPLFPEGKATLESAGGLLLREVSREFAARAAEVLAPQGVTTSVRGHVLQAARSGSGPLRWGAFAFVLAVALLIGGGRWQRAQRRALEEAAQAEAASRDAAATSAAVKSEAAKSEAAKSEGGSSERPAKSETGVAAAKPVLTVEELGRRAMSSVVAIHCRDTQGTGFFISDHEVLTNSHVACPAPEAARVVLRDGRGLIGHVTYRDEWHDVARLEVLGAGAAPLPLGTSTRAQAGAPVVFIGSPSGLEFTLHDGRISFVGRNLFGIGYLQFNASVNPGNSGGPLLDMTGAVIGIVTLKESGADGIGFALPVEYAQQPASPEWKAFLDQVAGEDSKEKRELLESVSSPRLFDVRFDGQQLVATLVQAGAQPPSARSFSTEVEQGGVVRCRLAAQVEQWRTLGGMTRSGEPEPRSTQWLRRVGLAEQLFIGRAVIDVADCEPKADASAQLLLRAGGEERGRVRVEPRVLASLSQRHRSESNAPSAQPAQLAQGDSQAEASWRAAFRQARSNAEAMRLKLESARSSLQQARGGLDEQSWVDYEREVARVAQQAEEDLRALERKAANNSIPLEWRR